MNGSDGPPGPITEPPALASLSPRWGSARTQVTITGTGFSTTPADNHVFFDGHPATVVSATATQLVVTPDLAVSTSTDIVVDVEVANQVSNALSFELVAPGTAHELRIPLPSAPTGVVAVGADIYIASGVNGVSRTGGLFKLSGGVVTRVVDGTLLPVGNNGQQIIDGPVALATFGGDVYYTTTFGAVRKYTVATGTVTDVLTLGGLGNGSEFPARTGLAFDAGGDLYVVDRNLPGIVRLRANNTVAVIMNAAFPGIFGIASDGTDLFVTNEQSNAVHRVSNLGATPSVTLIDSDIDALRGITTVGANVIVSADDGSLLSAPKAGGTLALFGDATGYLYPAMGLATAGTDVLMAQPNGGVVRRKPAAADDATIVAAGVRYAFSTLSLGGKWYVSTLGPFVFANDGPSLDQPDGAVVEIDPAAGASRVLATTQTPLGMAINAATELAVSDCFEGRIFSLDVATAVQTDLLTSADFTGCPGGVSVDANGDLYYVDASGTPTIGRLAGTTQTASHVTGLAADTFAMTLGGGTLFTTSMFDGAPLQTALVAAGGAATTLVPQAVFASGALGVAPSGALLGLRPISNELVSIDTTTGSVSPIGSTIPPGKSLTVSFIGSFLIGADQTVTAMDYSQGDLISIAP